MILCVSANPAVDRRMRVDRLVRGRVNRVMSSRTSAGGKAAHVAMALTALGEPAAWIGFLGGAAGRQCREEMRELEIEVVAIPTAAETRTNLEIIESDGGVTEVLEPGGKVTPGEVAQLVKSFTSLVFETATDKSEADDRRAKEITQRTSQQRLQVVISGSLPPGAPGDLYSRLIEICHRAGCDAYLDSNGEALIAGIESHPRAVKPNRQEAEVFLGRPIQDASAAAAVARKLIAAGAQRAAISLGAEGLLWLAGANARPILAIPPIVQVQSSVGCGDCALAGLVLAERRGLSAEDTARFAVACGTANCSAQLPARISSQDVERLQRLITTRVIGEADGTR